MEGPQFSTLAEAHVHRQLRFDVIGMTNVTEAKLAREAELCYATIAMITDYDCWHPRTQFRHASKEIIANLNRNAENAQNVLRASRSRNAARSQQMQMCGTRSSTPSSPIAQNIPAATKQRLAPIAGKYLD